MDKFLKIIIKNNIVDIENIKYPCLSNIVEIKDILLDKLKECPPNDIYYLLSVGYLDNLPSKEINLLDENCMYIGLCENCDEDSDLFNLEINEENNTQLYLEQILLNRKYKYPILYSDLFCKNCCSELFIEDPTLYY
ncbi:unknown similar to AMEV075 [Mythimna separata entomopoxvirus 'L']|uniref:Uncharacterized protein n=1 Tax=Mythimna separata entomopoxvirus 'L' TaxID=1293572 RepID=A0A916NYJ7_9POXV|nr:unknown similar to AMEV075 [Mythimna separata entomopoxvirus 'L']CCU56349.1 unknown similar to AMEV075 [Mythimna separata entomopoxvirus 'L']